MAPSSIEKVDKNFVPVEASEGMHWYDALDLGVEGKGWADTERPYDRLPAKAKAVVPEAVWYLSHHSAGLAVRFVTDATSIAARWTLLHAELAMPHMPATGVSGLDLYGLEAGRWRWAGVGGVQGVENSLTVASDLLLGPREYLLYLPLYNGVERVAVGVPEGARMEAAPPRVPGGPRSGEPGGAGAIVFYGSSIVQGGCACRSGMGYPEILGRRLGRPTINLGFSGNGRMEIEVAKLLAELDPAVYVIDCVPNMTAEQVADRIQPAVHLLRRAHPRTPIVLVENIIYQRAALQPPSAWGHVAKNVELGRALERLRASGITGLHLVPAEALLGDDGLGTVDGIHPTDVGFMRMAEALDPVVRPLLG